MDINMIMAAHIRTSDWDSDSYGNATSHYRASYGRLTGGDYTGAVSSGKRRAQCGYGHVHESALHALYKVFGQREGDHLTYIYDPRFNVTDTRGPLVYTPHNTATSDRHEARILISTHTNMEAFKRSREYRILLAQGRMSAVLSQKLNASYATLETTSALLHAKGDVYTEVYLMLQSVIGDAAAPFVGVEQ